jgi:hypothetical protein
MSVEALRFPSREARAALGRPPAADNLPAGLCDALARIPSGLHVLWTGDQPTGRANSRMAQLLACLPEIGAPVSLRVLLQRVAARFSLDGEVLCHYRQAIRQHQAAKPAVVLLLEKTLQGEFIAVCDVPFAGALDRRVRAGATVVNRGDGSCALPLRPTPSL